MNISSLSHFIEPDQGKSGSVSLPSCHPMSFSTDTAYVVVPFFLYARETRDERALDSSKDPSMVALYSPSVYSYSRYRRSL